MMDTKERVLRGLCKGLVWTKYPTSNIWRANTLIGTYKVFGIGGQASWDFDSATDARDRTSRAVPSAAAAQAAVEAHYIATLAAALDLDKLVALVEAAERAERDLTAAVKPDVPVVELLRLMSGAVLNLRTTLTALLGDATGTGG